MVIELEPLVLESTLTMQKILETDEHKGRVNLIRYFVDAEKKRLEARKMLQSMFGTKNEEGEMIPLSEVLGSSRADEILDDDYDDDDDDDDDSEEGDDDGGVIFSDADAFQ